MAPPRKPEHYTGICVSTYKDDLSKLDALVDALKSTGITNTSRSALIRLAIDHLHECPLVHFDSASRTPLLKLPFMTNRSVGPSQINPNGTAIFQAMWNVPVRLRSFVVPNKVLASFSINELSFQHRGFNAAERAELNEYEKERKERLDRSFEALGWKRCDACGAYGCSGR